MDSASPPKGLAIFDAFPSIRALGRAKLQQLCDEWTATQDARDFHVAAMAVGDEASGFVVEPTVNGGADGQRTPVKLEQIVTSLLRHIVTQGFDASQQALGLRIIELASQPLIHGSVDRSRAAGLKMAAGQMRAARQ